MLLDFFIAVWMYNSSEILDIRKIRYLEWNLLNSVSKIDIFIKVIFKKESDIL